MSRRREEFAPPQAAAAAPPARRKASKSRLLWLLLLAAGLAVAAIAANAWWWSRPQLEPLPAIATEPLEPEVAGLIETARTAVEREPSSPMAWGDLGAALRAHELGPEANVCFRNAERLDPSDYRWPYLLGVSLATTDADAALAAFRRAAALAPRQSHVQLRLAEALLDRDLRSEAAEIIDRVLSNASSHPRAQFAKARLLSAEGKFEESRSWAERSVAGASDKRAPRLLLAQLCRRLGDVPAEQRELAALAEIPEGTTEWEDPDVAAVLLLRCDRATRIRRLIEAQDYAAAEPLLREEIRQRGGDASCHYHLGVACFLKGKHEEAASAFRRAIALQADHVDAHYNLGHALRKLGADADAAAAFAEAVRLNPNHAFARINLAELLLQSGRREEAIEHLTAALRLAPDDQRAQALWRKTRE